jgi:hypothetical protein
VFCVQAFPAVVQLGVGAIDAHFALSQRPVQHDAGDEHVSPIDRHCVAPHTPLLHVPVQQSVETVHELPAPPHTLIDEAHLCVLGSQSVEQQSAPKLHVAPKTPHASGPPSPAAPSFVAESACPPSFVAESVCPPSFVAPSPALLSLAPSFVFAASPPTVPSGEWIEPSAGVEPSTPPPSSPVLEPVSSLLPQPDSTAVAIISAVISEREGFMTNSPRRVMREIPGSLCVQEEGCGQGKRARGSAAVQ